MSEFKDAMQLIWSRLPEKAINSAVKDFGKWLQARVLANGGHFEQIDEIKDNLHNRYW